MARRMPRIELMPVRRVCKRDAPEKMKTRQPEIRVAREANSLTVRCLQIGLKRVAVL